MPISSLFHTISQAYNNPHFDEAISATHAIFVEAGKQFNFANIIFV